MPRWGPGGLVCIPCRHARIGDLPVFASFCPPQPVSDIFAGGVWLYPDVRDILLRSWEGVYCTQHIAQERGEFIVNLGRAGPQLLEKGLRGPVVPLEHGESSMVGVEEDSAVGDGPLLQLVVHPRQGARNVREVLPVDPAVGRRPHPEHGFPRLRGERFYFFLYAQLGKNPERVGWRRVEPLRYSLDPHLVDGSRQHVLDDIRLLPGG